MPSRSPKPPAPAPAKPGSLDADGFAADVTDSGWVPDILGPGFEQRTFPLGKDDEGPVVCTVVRSLAAASKLAGLVADKRLLAGVDVLYVHGWSDYFFNRTLARFFTDRGANFYALDLRKYGRSLRRWQTPGYIEDLSIYDKDINQALRAMGRLAPKKPSESVEPHELPCKPARGAAPLLLLGHSTGGLTLSLWAHRYPGAAQGLLLNSPWLEFQLSDIGRHAVTPLVRVGAKLRPKDAFPQMDMGFYTRAQREEEDPDDPMQINPAWRPEQTNAVHSGWLQAIFDGQQMLSEGLRIECPVGVLLSRRTGIPAKWTPDLTRTDTVLEVESIARDALKLGPYMTMVRLDGALHDVFLSTAHVRKLAYLRMEQWLTGWVATRHIADAAAHQDFCPPPTASPDDGPLAADAPAETAQAPQPQRGLSGSS